MRSIDKARHTLYAVTQNVTGVTGAIRETSHSAENVLDASGKLAMRATSLKDGVDHFESEVAAA